MAGRNCDSGTSVLALSEFSCSLPSAAAEALSVVFALALTLVEAALTDAMSEACGDGSGHPAACRLGDSGSVSEEDEEPVDEKEPNPLGRRARVNVVDDSADAGAGS